MIITESQLALATRIQEACDQQSLALFKTKNTPSNFGVTPALALAVALYPPLEEKTAGGSDHAAA